MSDPQERGLTAQRETEYSVSPPPAEISAPDRSSAIAKWVFAGALVGTGIFLLVGFTRLWFSLDEWDFLAHRGLRLTNMGIFYPHNEHWVTIPLLVWRGIFNIVGVRDYWLYALPLILAHLATVYLLWRFMLRHQVEMWTATFLAVAFAVVGVGSQNLIFAFQLTFVGSVAFGMLAIDAIETDRTWLAPLWLVGSLMCSDIGIPMIVACGLVALAQRKLREAAIAVGPPIFIFLVWYLAIGYHGSASNSTSVKFDLGGLSSYVWTGLTSSFSGFLDAPHFVGVLIARSSRERRRSSTETLRLRSRPPSFLCTYSLDWGGCTMVSASRRRRATRISPLPWSCHSLDCWSRRRCASLTCGLWS